MSKNRHRIEIAPITPLKLQRGEIPVAAVLSILDELMERSELTRRGRMMAIWAVVKYRDAAIDPVFDIRDRHRV